MCQKKPGPRCARHANQQLKRAYSKYKKLKNRPMKNVSDVINLQGALESHSFAVAMYYATPFMLKRINPKATSPNFVEAQYLNRAIKSAVKSLDDFDNETEINVGNYIKRTKNGLVKSRKSTKVVVNNQGNRFVVWDKNDPYILETLDDNGTTVGREKLDPKKKAYGFETQKKPDIHWAIWYTHQAYSYIA